MFTTYCKGDGRTPETTSDWTDDNALDPESSDDEDSNDSRNDDDDDASSRGG